MCIDKSWHLHLYVMYIAFVNVAFNNFVIVVIVVVSADTSFFLVILFVIWHQVNFSVNTLALLPL